MWDLFNVNDAKGLNVFEVENGIVDMTQTGDSFDRFAKKRGNHEDEIKRICFTQIIF